MKLRSLIVLALSASLAIGCIPQIQEQGGQSQTPEKETETETETEPTEKSALELTWVSGHLGSYWDCPSNGLDISGKSQGSEGPAAGGAAPAAEPADSDAGPRAGDCAEGEACGGWMNCEDAQLTFVITNTGNALADDMQITDFELLDANLAPITTLQVLSIVRTDGHEYNGKLHAGEEVTVRVNFQGPVDGNGWGDMLDAAVRIIMVTGDDADAELVSPELQSLPAMAT